MYTRKEVENATREYFKGDELATDVWINKYALRDKDNNLLELSPEDMHERLAKEVYRIEKNYSNPTPYEKILELFTSGKFMFGGSPMAGIGNETYKTSLSNCFVIDSPSDSYGGIMRSDEELVQLMKRRGGVGTDLSKLRPSGAMSNNSVLNGLAGSTLYMHRYSNSTREVSQGNRRGALMLSQSIVHPDADKFAVIKSDKTKVTGANISLRITDEFMEAVKEDKLFTQVFPIDMDRSNWVSMKDELFPKNEIGKMYKHDNKNEYTKVVKAKELFDLIVDRNWNDAEPGMLFWDTIIKESPSDQYPGIQTLSTNPCGEIPLSAYDSCRLGCMVLSKYVINGRFNMDEFSKDVMVAQRIMDNLIDLEIEKVEKIIAKIESDPEDASDKSREYFLWNRVMNAAKGNRRTGLGITAAGDMLAMCGYTYGTSDANKFYEEVHKQMAIASYTSSIIMAKERDCFSNYDDDYERYNSKSEFIKRIIPELSESTLATWEDYGRRNISNLTIAPTGSVSLIAQCTSGIEPLFMPYYSRRKKTDDKKKCDFMDTNGDMWEEFFVVHNGLQNWIEEEYKDDPEYLDYILSDKRSLKEAFKKSPYFGSTSDSIDYIGKVDMQGAVQKWVDHSISVTVNLPKDITKEEVAALYMRAWESGCKGLTIYREGSRDGVLVNDTQKPKEDKVKRPKRIKAEIVRFNNNYEKWIAVVGLIDNKPYEIFTGKAESFAIPLKITEGFIVKEKINGKGHYSFEFKDKSGYKTTIEGLDRTFNSEYWNYAKLISGTLRHNMPVKNVVDLVGSLEFQEDSINTWKNGVTRALKKFIEDGTKAKGKCTECEGENLAYQDGCLTCLDCGYSKCG